MWDLRFFDLPPTHTFKHIYSLGLRHIIYQYSCYSNNCVSTLCSVVDGKDTKINRLNTYPQETLQCIHNCPAILGGNRGIGLGKLGVGC